MKTAIRFTLAGACAWLGGCATTSRSGAGDPSVKPGLILLTADQAAQRGIRLVPANDSAAPRPDLRPLDASAVIAPPGVKVYTVNRAIDPSDPDLLHEEHLVYRRESTPQWRLDASTEQKLLIGPRVTDGRQDLQPVLNRELTTYLSEQRRATEENQKAIEALFHAVETLSRQQQAVLERQIQGAAAQPIPDDADSGKTNRSVEEPPKDGRG